MTGCTAASSRGEYMMKKSHTDKEKANVVMDSLTEALDKRDVESVKELFSKYALENSVDLDGKIEELMDYYLEYDGENIFHRSGHAGISKQRICGTGNRGGRKDKWLCPLVSGYDSAGKR